MKRKTDELEESPRGKKLKRNVRRRLTRAEIKELARMGSKDDFAHFKPSRVNREAIDWPSNDEKE